MRTWKEINSWLENKIFPKTDSKETRIAKLIALWQVAVSALFTFGGVLMGVGISFMTLAISFESDSVLVSSNQTSPILSELGDRLMEGGNHYLNIGIVIIIFGMMVSVIAISREK